MLTVFYNEQKYLRVLLKVNKAANVNFVSDIQKTIFDIQQKRYSFFTHHISGKYV